MPGPLRILACSLVAAVLLAGPRHVTAETCTVPTIELADASMVVAGRRVEIRWRNLPPRVEELEILLSVDGGQRYPLRVSPELDGRENCYVWRVPHLPTTDARLKVRMRVDGVETNGPVSASFAIAAVPGREVELRQIHEGGWWTGISPSASHALPSVDAPAPTPQLRASASSVSFDDPDQPARGFVLARQLESGPADPPRPSPRSQPPSRFMPRRE